MFYSIRVVIVIATLGVSTACETNPNTPPIFSGVSRYHAVGVPDGSALVRFWAVPSVSAVKPMGKASPFEPRTPAPGGGFRAPIPAPYPHVRFSAGADIFLTSKMTVRWA